MLLRMGYVPSQRLAAQRRAVLHAERKRTGISLEKLLTGRDDAPEDFDDVGVRQFYRGLADKVRMKDLRYVRRLWSEMPSRGATSPIRCVKRKDNRIDLTPAMRAELRHHWMRVGLNVEAFFDRLPYQPPGLSPMLIRRWIVDTEPRHVRKDYLELVLMTWKSLPDKLGKLNRIHFVPFAEDCARL